MLERKEDNMEKAVITIKFVDHYGQIETLNIPESLDDTFSHLKGRIEDLERRGYKRTGDATIQFVKI